MSSIHEVAAEEQDDGSTRYRYHVPFFNPGSNRTRRSWLRLVNPGQNDLRIVISARDDGGAPPESGVRLTLSPGAARALTAQQLETGDSEFAGRFGDGTGKWRLFVSADRPLLVMSLLENPTGNLTNLSSPGISTKSVTPPRPDRVVDLTDLSPADGFVIQGDETWDVAGASVSSVGDVNGDGYDDVIVGAPGGDDGGTGAGEAYVLFGKAGRFGTVDATGRRVVDLTHLSSADGFVIQGDEEYDGAGSSVSSAGDVNGDGYDDVIVGSGGDDGGTAAGAAYIIFGAPTHIGLPDSDLLR